MIVKVNKKRDKQTLEKALDFTLPDKYVVISYLSDNGLAIIAYSEYRLNDVEIYGMGVGKWANRTMLKHCANYIFNTLNCERCTAKIDPDNKRAIKLVDKLGFKKEGYLRVHNVNIYSLIKSECKYL